MPKSEEKPIENNDTTKADATASDTKKAKASDSKSANKGSSETETASKKTIKAASKENFAVIETGSKQYIVKSGTIIDIEKVDSDKKSISFDKVLLVYDGKSTKIGQPYIEGASVSASILEQKRDDKKIVFKFKRKTGYKKTQGHRQSLTTVKIDGING